MTCGYTTTEFNGRKISLAYTVGAMFELNDMLEEGETVLSLLECKNADGLDKMCRCIEVLARNGAGVMEGMGFTRPYTPDKKELHTFMRPTELVTIKKAALDAILIGYGREVENPEEEVDLELANLEKK